MATAGQRLLTVGATLGASAVFASSAQAAGNTYTVQTNGDNASTSPCDSSNNCATLRDAIAAATADGGSDTITFASSLNNQTITLASGAGELAVSVPLTIETPPSVTKLTIAGNSNTLSRVFDITASGAVTLSGLTIQNGHATGSNSAGEGGAIYNTSNLTLNDDTIVSSSARYTGGGIESSGPLAISGSIVTQNSSTYAGGGIEAKYRSTVDNSTITNNQSGYVGGGISAYDALSVSNSHISGNAATGANNSNGGAGGGVALKYGAQITNSTISGNTATYGGGMAMNLYHGSNAFTTTVTDSTISGNTATDGGGIDVEGSSNPGRPITISASTISGNSGGSGSFGGGILIGGRLSDPFDVIDSTISGNSANNGGGVSIGYGSEQVLYTGGSIAFDNSTIAGNSAAASGGGGGIWLSQHATDVTASTIFSTIVGHNTAAGAGNDLGQDSTAPPTSGFNASYSLIQNPGNGRLLTSQSVIEHVDPQLGPLADNGGPTQTMLPAFSSPVIDQGKDTPGLATDQRGDQRTVNNGKTRPPGGDGTDIGAVEVKIPIAVTIEPATGVTMSKATLNGKVTTNGAAVTSWYFEWGRTTSYGHQTPSQSIKAGNGQVPVSFVITGLHKGLTYHYRLVATSASGTTVTSADAKFTTAAPSIKVTPRIVLPGTRVQLSGSTGACRPGDRVTLLSYAFSHAHEFAGEPAVYATAMKNGRYATSTTIPKSRAPRSYSITGRCGGANFGVSADLRVIAVPKPKFTG